MGTVLDMGSVEDMGLVAEHWDSMSEFPLSPTMFQSYLQSRFMNRVFTIKSYCGFMSLKTGSVITGIIQILVASVVAFMDIFLPYESGRDLDENDVSLLIILVFCACISVLLIWGVLRSNKAFVAKLLYVQFVLLFFCFFLFLSETGYCLITGEDRVATVAIAFILILGLQVYGIMAVFSYNKAFENVEELP